MYISSLSQTTPGTLIAKRWVIIT